MSTRFEEDAEHGEAISEMRPWWIFKDGDKLPIERRGDRIRARSARVLHQREEEKRPPPRRQAG